MKDKRKSVSVRQGGRSYVILYCGPEAVGEKLILGMK
uniref:Uncharacterized protein n=1 Tax=Anguilla anguilla TaxID=7936 RepID=A0A0E9SQI7_ANGAN